MLPLLLDEERENTLEAGEETPPTANEVEEFDGEGNDNNEEVEEEVDGDGDAGTDALVIVEVAIDGNKGCGGKGGKTTFSSFVIVVENVEIGLGLNRCGSGGNRDGDGNGGC